MTGVNVTVDRRVIPFAPTRDRYALTIHPKILGIGILAGNFGYEERLKPLRCRTSSKTYRVGPVISFLLESGRQAFRGTSGVRKSLPDCKVSIARLFGQRPSPAERDAVTRPAFSPGNSLIKRWRPVGDACLQRI